MNRKTAADMGTAITGCILGTAVGDAIGLPMEGLSKRRLKRMYPELGRHHFFFGRGMVSDDTEHTCMTAQALAVSNGNVEKFRRSLAKQLKYWLLMLPAGTGLATARAILKLMVGCSPDKSGVYSAGNGPAMRNAIIGVWSGEDRGRMRDLVRASTRITHTDLKAEYGALAVALAAHHSASGMDISPSRYHQELSGLLGDEATELLDLVAKAAGSAWARRSTESFAEEIGCADGVSGYIYHTVPVVLHSWFLHPRDLRSAVMDVLRCGGDTDTTAAIVGGIVGARVGVEGIPPDWMDELIEWPRSVRWMKELAENLDKGRSRQVEMYPMGLPATGVLLRNLFFLIVVVMHGIRRLFPPY